MLLISVPKFGAKCYVKISLRKSTKSNYSFADEINNLLHPTDPIYLKPNCKWWFQIGPLSRDCDVVTNTRFLIRRRRRHFFYTNIRKYLRFIAVGGKDINQRELMITEHRSDFMSDLLAWIVTTFKRVLCRKLILAHITILLLKV